MADLVTIDDLTDEQLDWLFARADRNLIGGIRPVDPAPEVATVFFSSSLRTRAGFTAAAHRLRGRVIDVEQRRWGHEMSAAETVSDTLRTLAGLADVLVVRDSSGPAIDTGGWPACALVNAGGLRGEHPSQALIDYWSMMIDRGAVPDLHVALVGDLTMRAARSLLALLSRRPPRALSLVSPAGREDHGVALSPGLAARTRREDMSALADADVIYMIGLAPGEGPDRLEEPERMRFQLTPDRLADVDPAAVVMCPLPLIDEISEEARRDPRMRFWQVNDRATAMRAAILEHCLELAD